MRYSSVRFNRTAPREQIPVEKSKYDKCVTKAMDVSDLFIHGSFLSKSWKSNHLINHMILVALILFMIPTLSLAAQVTLS